MHQNCAKELLVRGFSYSNGNIVALHNNRIFGYSDFMSEIISSEETYKKTLKNVGMKYLKQVMINCITENQIQLR